MVQITNIHWAVEVPDDARNISISKGRFLGYQTGGGEIIDLPPGTWQIVCTSKEATEEQAASIVQIISNGKISGRPQYRRYDRDPVKDTPAKSWTRDARHALETLLTSKGCDINKNYLILKKQ